MNLRTIIATAATAAVLATTGVAIAGAATTTNSPPTPTAAQSAPASAATPAARPARARHFRIRHRIRRLLKGAGGVVTQTIGIDRTTLRAELRSGKTIAEIATEHNVQPQTVIDALVAAANKKIDAAVAAGKLTPERASRLEARLPARITQLVDNWHPRHVKTS